MKPLISIVIPALNEEHYLPNLLQDITRQAIRNFEVIVVNATSEDKTLEVAETFQKMLPLTIITTTKKNVAHSRNSGVTKATGDYVFFLDADSRIEPGVVEAISTVITTQKVDVVIPAIKPDIESLATHFSFFFANGFVKATHLIGKPFSTGGNIVIRRTIFEKIGGFDETLFICEDHALIQAAKYAGAKILLSRNIAITFSMRRYRKEGWALYWKYTFSTLYFLFYGKIRKHLYDYPMGGDYYESKKAS